MTHVSEYKKLLEEMRNPVQGPRRVHHPEDDTPIERARKAAGALRYIDLTPELRELAYQQVMAGLDEREESDG